MMDEISKVAALVCEVMSTATKAITANAQEWKGTISVSQPEENRIDYRFGVRVPYDHEVLAKMEAEFPAVTQAIEQNCHIHIVRQAPIFQTDRDFETDTQWAQGYMRGHMIGIGVGAGPATRSAPPPSERVVMSSGT